MSYPLFCDYCPAHLMAERVTNGQLVGGGLHSFTWITTDLGTTNHVAAFHEYNISGTSVAIERSDLIEYDANGNITKYGNVTYEYDKLGRLVRENNPTTGIDKTVTWCYDISGNILSRTEYAYTAGDLAGVTPTNTFTYTYDTDWKDKLVEVTKNGDTHHTFSYDQAGNPTSYRGTNLTWERGRLLKRYNNITMQYDANGIRTRKIIPGLEYFTTTEYLYSGNNLLQELVSLTGPGQSSTTYKAYLYNSQGIIGFVDGVNAYTYRKNMFGDIIAIYNGSTKVAEYAYDAWGNCTIVSDTNNVGRDNPFRYRGYYWDNDLQLYYLMSRYYDPQTGRFINADSLEYLDPETIGGLNLYAYCYSNPIMFRDVIGFLPQAISLVGDLVGGFLESIGDFVTKTAKNYLKDPMTISQAQKLIRKNGWSKSARAVLRDYSDDALRTVNIGKGLSKASSILGGVLFAVSTVDTWITNYHSGSDSWITDSLVDTAIDGMIFAIGCIPGWGWIVALGLSIVVDVIDNNTTLIDDIKNAIA